MNRRGVLFLVGFYIGGFVGKRKREINTIFFLILFLFMKQEKKKHKMKRERNFFGTSKQNIKSIFNPKLF